MEGFVIKTLLIGTILAVAWKLGPHIGKFDCLLIPHTWQPWMSFATTLSAARELACQSVLAWLSV